MVPLLFVSICSGFTFRPPAIPLITADPFMQTFVGGDTSVSDTIRHWDGAPKEMMGLIRIDNQSYGFLGQQGLLPSLVQRSVAVHPTRTLFALELPGKLALNLTLLQTMFTDDVYRLSRPVYYLTMAVGALDGASHAVQVYLDFSAQHVVNDCAMEAVQWKSWTRSTTGLKGVQLGSEAQRVLGAKCDGCNINWGWLHLAINHSATSATVHAGSTLASRRNFIEGGTLPGANDTRQPRLCADELPGLSLWNDFGTVAGGLASRPTQPLTALLAYDDVEAVYYFGKTFKGLWSHNYTDVQAAMAHALQEYPQMLAKSVSHDASLQAALCKAAGTVCSEYAALGSLAYRQTLAALKPVWNHEAADWWVFLKEISTNGDMNTMDVIYPASPMLLATEPELLKRLLLPVLAYAANETFIRFTNPYSPHQLGTYPIANDSTARQEPMPLENSGNMLLMLLAIVQRQGAASALPWLGRHLPMLRSWTDELVRTAEFPADQLCTDDFTGRLPNNTNLGAKGILGIRVYAELCELLGTASAQPIPGCSGADKYAHVANAYAATWQRYAYTDKVAPHYKLSFNDIKEVPDSWSIKYNLLWQRILKLSPPPFPQSVLDTEVAYYKTKANAFGIPLDPRHTWVKTDWLSWAACLSGNDDDFAFFFWPIFKFANTTSSRHPFTDLYDTKSGKQSWGGFVARPVIGGIFARLLLV